MKERARDGEGKEGSARHTERTRPEERGREDMINEGGEREREAEEKSCKVKGKKEGEGMGNGREDVALRKREAR